MEGFFSRIKESGDQFYPDLKPASLVGMWFQLRRNPKRWPEYLCQLDLINSCTYLFAI